MTGQAAVGVAGAVLLMFSTVFLVRRQLLSIRYGLGWMAVSVGGIVGVPLLIVFSDRFESLGFTPTGFSVGVLIGFLGLVCLQLSVSLSGLHRSVQDLAEHGALVEQRVRALESSGRDEDAEEDEA